jgi:SAM-dependent methyltransferase
MATYEEVLKIPPEEFCQRMITTYPMRFNEQFWEIFDRDVVSRVSRTPLVVDLGTGPGLFVQDVARRFPQGQFYGYDLSPVMIAHAQTLDCNGARVEWKVEDIYTNFPAFAPASVDLLAINYVFHGFDYPLPILEKIWEILTPQGIFLLYDWLRTPLPEYLGFFEQVDKPMDLERRYLQFARHNRYTLTDLTWLLETQRFRVQQVHQMNKYHTFFLIQRA